MYSDKKNILQTVALLRSCHIKEVVLCPGSRNAPIVQTFSACPDFNCYAVTDERSAGFFAIGRALQTGEPAVVCCTSGSALLNLHPAVCEAFYQKIPLIVISADRPAAWIGQMDGQTLPQPDVFGTLVKKSVNLPEIHTEEDEWYVNRLINEALLEMNHHGYGPVHINIPLSEPLFRFTEEELPQVRRITRLDVSGHRKETLNFLKESLSHYQRCMLITGQLTKQEAETIANLIPTDKMVWLSELLGNNPSTRNSLRQFDTLLYAVSDNELETLRPELVITVGGHIVSKRLKKFLRNTKSLVHWHISPDGQPADLFCKLDKIFECSSAEFFRLVSEAEPTSSPNYPKLWHDMCDSLIQLEVAYSELTAVRRVLDALPSPSTLHLANSSSVRLAELFSLPEGVTVQCNRGVNGIEGSMSAATGYAANSDELNVLLIGDLSFFYDMNALWNGHVGKNLRIVVLNNGAGAIFHVLPGLKMSEQINRFVAAGHQASAEGWACSRGFTYLKATDTLSLQQAIQSLYDSNSDAPVLLEIFTDAQTDATEQRHYYHQIKEEWQKRPVITPNHPI